MRVIFLAVVMLFSQIAVGEIEYSDATKINRFLTFNSYGDGDVVFRVESPTSGCYGYWITKTDKGYDANLSSILSAYHAKTTIKASGYNDQLWQGSSSAWCKLYAVEFVE